MARRVVVATNYSEQSETAIRRAIGDLRIREIPALHVVDFRSSDLGHGRSGDVNAWADWFGAAREHAEELISTAGAIADEFDHGITTEGTVGEDTRGIVEYVGGQGIERPLLGSVAETVARRSRIPCRSSDGRRDPTAGRRDPRLRAGFITARSQW